MRLRALGAGDVVRVRVRRLGDSFMSWGNREEGVGRLRSSREVVTVIFGHACGYELLLKVGRYVGLGMSTQPYERRYGLHL